MKTTARARRVLATHTAYIVSRGQSEHCHRVSYKKQPLKQYVTRVGFEPTTFPFVNVFIKGLLNVKPASLDSNTSLKMAVRSSKVVFDNCFKIIIKNAKSP